MVSNFIVQALRGNPLTLYGDGSQSRSFCYVDDLVPALVALMNATGDAAAPVNIGNPEEYTIAELAETILDLTGSRSRIERQPAQEDDPMQRCPDISKAKKLLDWAPSTPLREGLARTVAYFDSLLSGTLPD